MQHHLVPHFILQKHAAGEDDGRFPGVALFVDTSGFTPLTAELQAYGTGGAETLANVLLAVFAPIIEAIYAHGGFVAGFAGDACKAVFSGTEQAAYLAALAAAKDIRDHMAEHNRYATPHGNFPFAVRTSIASGEVAWNIWQTDAAQALAQRAVYTFGGAAIDAAIRGEALAQAGDVIISQSVQNALDGLAGLAVAPLADDDEFGRVVSMPDELPERLPTAFAPAAVTAVIPFYPAELITQTSQGEFRRVLTLFINLQALPDTADSPFMRTFFRLLHQYGGYLCRLGRIGSLDAGGTLLLFWGAPTSHENDVERVLNFILDLQEQTAVSLRAGITYQIVYAGFVGSPRREEYTCYGLSVNLAARLMVGASWGDVWVDEAVAQRAETLFRLDDLGERPFKGFSQPLPAYQLQRRRIAVTDPFFRGSMVGRQGELGRLNAAFAPLQNGRFGGVITVSGEAGIGKSRLLHDCLSRAPILEEGELFLCQTDEILREPLNPFRYFLRHYFEQSPRAGEAANKAEFESILDFLIEDTPDEGLQAELDRTRSFLGALVDLYWPDSLYDKLEPRLRQENTFTALKSLIKAESLRQPVILQIEDVHWLDEGSRRFLLELTRNVADFPFIVLLTTRDPALDVSLADEVPQQTITLGSLNATEVAHMASTRLGTAVSADLTRLLLERTDGNPFFVEQLVIYLQEQQLLRPSAVGMVLETAVSILPGELQAILVARIDKLTQEVRQVVQTAAVLGREFDVQVLSHMLRGETALDEKVKTAEAAAIWSALSELRYLFKHALLRDAAYDMQLQAQRRQLHQIAANAITQLYANDLTSYYADLAYHYGQAALPEEEARYARLAGEAAAEKFANSDALRYLNRALELTDESDYETRFALLLARAQIYDLLAEREEQAADIAQMRTIADTVVDDQQYERQAQVALAQARLFEITADADGAVASAAEAVRLAQLSQNKKLEAEGRIRWGISLGKQGKFDEARDQVREILTFAGDTGLPVMEGRALMQLGNYDFLQEMHEPATEYYQKALTIFRNFQDKRGEAATLYNLSLIKKFESPPEAEIYQRQALQIYQQMGDRQGATACFNNIAIFYRYIGDFERAFNHAAMGETITREIGARHDEAVSLSCMADSSRHLGDYHSATQYFGQCIPLAQELGEPRLQCFFHSLHGILLYLQGEYQQAIEAERQAVEFAASCGMTGSHAISLTFLGHALVEANRWEAADMVYQEARTLHESLKDPKNEMDLYAGMARLARKRGHTAQAYNYVLQVVDLLAENDVNGVEEPALVYLTCYEILAEQGDDRATAVLQEGYDLLQQRAAMIEDNQRRTQFLSNVEAHRHLQEVYDAMQGTEGAGSSS